MYESRIVLYDDRVVIISGFIRSIETILIIGTEVVPVIGSSFIFCTVCYIYYVRTSERIFLRSSYSITRDGTSIYIELIRRKDFSLSIRIIIEIRSTLS